MDSYAEQIVKKSDGGADNQKRTLCLAGGVFGGILMVFLGMAIIKSTLIGTILGVGVFYAGLYMGTNYDVEYEYLIVNGEFDIDKILAKKRRQKMLSVKVSDFENFGRYTDETKEDDDATVIWAVGTSEHEEYDTFYADFNHEVHGKCRLLFSPSVRVLRELKISLRGNLKMAVGELPPEEEY